MKSVRAAAAESIPRWRSNITRDAIQLITCAVLTAAGSRDGTGSGGSQSRNGAAAGRIMSRITRWNSGMRKYNHYWAKFQFFMCYYDSGNS